MVIILLISIIAAIFMVVMSVCLCVCQYFLCKKQDLFAKKAPLLSLILFPFFGLYCLITMAIMFLIYRLMETRKKYVLLIAISSTLIIHTIIFGLSWFTLLGYLISQ